MRIPLVRLLIFDHVVEISFDASDVPMRNTECVKYYVKECPQLFHAVALMRRWADEWNIHDSFKGTLNTYGLVLLLINVLIVKFGFPKPDAICEGLKNETIPLGRFMRSVFKYYGEEFKWEKDSGLNTIHLNDPSLCFTLARVRRRIGWI